MLRYGDLSPFHQLEPKTQKEKNKRKNIEIEM